MNQILRKFENLREQNIVSKFQPFLGKEKTILDVGCGTGNIAALLAKQFALEVQGIDIKTPAQSIIPFRLFNGKTIPFQDNSFDLVMLIDVLHHIKGRPNRQQLLKECLRVAKRSIIIKDHYYSNFFQNCYLKLVDFFSNVPLGIYTPFEFLPREHWESLKPVKTEYWTLFGIPNIMIKLDK